MTNSPVASLTLALCRQRLDADAIAAARTLLGPDPPAETWQAFVDTARELRVAAMLAWNVRRLTNDGRSSLLPASVVHELDSSYRWEVARNRMLPAEIDRVTRIAHVAGVPTAVRKGGRLARSTYPDVGLRPMGDIDLLAPVELADRLAAALDANGYREGRPRGAELHPLDRTAQLYLRLYGTGPPPRHRLSGDPARPVISIDIGTSLFGRNEGFQVPAEDLLERAVRHRSDGAAPLVLSTADMMLDLCVNAYQSCTTLRNMNMGKHRRLINFVDMADFVMLAGDEFPWSDFLDLVAGYGVDRPVLYALAHLDEVFPNEVPPAVLARLRKRCPGWSTFLTEYGQWELAEPRRWQVDFLTRLFDKRFDRDIPRSNAPV